MSENLYTRQDLAVMQKWPFEKKVMVAQAKIIEWYVRHNGMVFCSVSGGKDSVVTLDIARKCFPDIEAVYVNAGLDFPEVRRFAEAIPNVTVLKPIMRFDEVIRTYGWCYPSKDVSKTLYYARKGSKWALDRLAGVNADGTPSWFRQTHYQKWAFLLNSNFILSDKCCEVSKEKPLRDYAKQSGKYPIIGTMAAESRRRMESWLRRGCNAFDKRYPSSQPISIFTEQDVLMYLRRYNLPYASVYGDIVADKKGRLSTTLEKRTGCIFCPVSCHLDKQNRFERLKTTHPKHYDYVINTLGLGGLLDYAGVPY